MSIVLYVGMDVHKESYTVCTFRMGEEHVENVHRMEPGIFHVKSYLEQIRGKYSEEVEFVCGYEAGCLGYTL